jgi:hypothetical protein|tara:strand:+ start:75 stop:281 length:207 start_codon:yes stop_codon:yes gene_type:complete
VIQQELEVALTKRRDSGARDELARLQQNKSLSQVYGFSGPGFDSTYKKSPKFDGAGHGHGFLGPGFKK